MLQQAIQPPANEADEVFDNIKAMTEGNAQAALKVQAFSLEQLRLKSKNGRTGWWFLAYAAYFRHPDAFMAARWRWKDELVVEDFLTTAESGEKMGQSVLYVLACAAGVRNGEKGHPEAFRSVWREWGRFMPPQCLQMKPDHGSCKNQSIMYLLFKAEHETINSCRQIIEDILAYVPNVCSNEEIHCKPDNDTPSIAEHLQQGPFWSVNIKGLLDARNVFFLELSRAETSTHPNFKQLKFLAQEALDRGYLNAFYELGKFFESKGEEVEACKAFAKVPRKSRDYAQAMGVVQQKYFNMAMSPNSSERTNYLKKSLKFGLKLPDNSRLDSIQQIAWAYITDGKEKGLKGFDIVPLHYLQAMHRKTKTSWCFKVFDDIKQARMLEERCREQEKRIQLLEGEMQAVGSLSSLLSKLSMSQQGANHGAPMLHMYEAQESPTIVTEKSPSGAAVVSKGKKALF
ncbi:MAG: hypothetical protein JSR17_10045 [Proteobacteria bacterium]|nr:hypothetical protein [Pseudomonadota bacterium]